MTAIFMFLMFEEVRKFARDEKSELLSRSHKLQSRKVAKSRSRGVAESWSRSWNCMFMLNKNKHLNKLKRMFYLCFFFANVALHK